MGKTDLQLLLAKSDPNFQPKPIISKIFSYKNTFLYALINDLLQKNNNTMCETKKSKLNHKKNYVIWLLGKDSICLGSVAQSICLILWACR